MATLVAPYAPRKPTETVLYAAVRETLETFLRWTKETYAAPLPRYVVDELRGYLRCGVFAHGFVRAHCDACGHDLLVAFSCKGRGLCPSCAGRRMANTAAHLVDRVLPVVPVRQWVLSLPWELRRHAAFDARSLTAFDRIFVEQIIAHHKRVARRDGRRAPQTGAITFVQRFGGSLNLHVHFHVVVLDGTFERTPAGVVFHEAPPPTPQELAAVLARTAERIARWLRKHRGTNAAPSVDAEPTALDACAQAAVHPGAFAELPDEPTAAEPDLPSSKLSVSLAGFSLHAGVRMGANDDVGRERLCRYGARPPLALGNLRRLADGRYAYRCKYARRGTARHRIMTPLELLARLAALIPPPRHPLVRYHGALAPHSSWRRLVIPRRPDELASPRHTHPIKPPTPQSQHPSSAEPPRATPRAAPDTPPKTRPTLIDAPSIVSSQAQARATLLRPNILSVTHWSRIDDGLLRAASPRIAWPQLLRRTFDVDILRCPSCDGRLRVLSVLTTPDTIHAILDSLSIPTLPPPIPRARPPADLLEPSFD